jgi:hypothetical protein
VYVRLNHLIAIPVRLAEMFRVRSIKDEIVMPFTVSIHQWNE